MTRGLLRAPRTVEWGTPAGILAQLDAEFCFTMDPAPPWNGDALRVDGLATRWDGVVWLNPPYGRTIGDWLAKAAESARAGATVVALLPVRSDTSWWHAHVMRAAEVRFIRGRVKFVPHEQTQSAGRGGGGAPFPSAVVVWRPGCDGPPQVSTAGGPTEGLRPDHPRNEHPERRDHRGGKDQQPAHDSLPGIDGPNRSNDNGLPRAAAVAT